MRFMHLSDLHIGKRVNEISMLEDQEYILFQILELMEKENIEAVLLAGDIYDKSVPSAEAVLLFDDFLTRLAEKNLPVFVISGNHDSAERIAFASRLVRDRGVYLSPVFSGAIAPITLEDKYGEINVYLLPFIKPAYVKRVFPEAEIENYEDAVRAAIAQMQVDTAKRNVLVAHQFVTGAARTESENLSIGGLDNVDADVFDDFDYVALGHLHGAQHMGRETVRYCGTPLKYSFSEANQVKSATIVDMEAKGKVKITTVPLTPRRDLREIRGTYMELTAREKYKDTAVDDYLHITLTDEEDIPDAVGKLKTIYPNLMRLDYDNTRTRMHRQVEGNEAVERKSPLELFEEFYELQNNQPMSGEQRAFVLSLMEQIREGGV